MACKYFFSIFLAQISTYALANTYSTNFPLNENPISEGGKWTGGQNAGGNLWGNVQTNGGRAYGVSEPTTYGDPTAILTGSWGPNQTASAIVSVPAAPSNCCHEVELRLRMTVSANSITGYEAYCSVATGDHYCHVARWNGPNGKWCPLDTGTNPLYAANGDLLKATVTGTNPVTVTLYKNGSQILQVQDTGASCNTGGAAGPFTSGNPGIGFYDNVDSNWSAFAFSTFTVTDGASSPPPPPGTPTFIKAAAAPTSLGSFASVNVPITAASGHFLAVAVGWNDATSTVQSVTDNVGDTFTAASSIMRIGSGSSALSQILYYASNIKSGVTSVTVTFNNGSTTALNPDVRVAEYANVAGGLEAINQKSGTSTLADGGSVTTTAPYDLIVGAAMSLGTASGAVSPFTTRIISSPGQNILEDNIPATSGSYDAKANLSTSVNWVAITAAFKSAANLPPAKPRGFDFK